MPTTIINTLQSCPQFSGFNHEELTLFAAYCEFSSYMETQTVFSFGRKADSIFIVRSGQLRLYLNNGAFKDFSAGELFGELSAFSQNGSLGAIKCLDDAELVSFSCAAVFAESGLPLDLRYRFLQNITHKIIGYFYDEIRISSETLLQKGECDICEFKGAFNDGLLERISESIAAFANAKGGAILIGVRDDRFVVGVDVKPENFDQEQRTILEGIKRRMGSYIATLLQIDFQELAQLTIIRLDVLASPTPVYMTKAVGSAKNQGYQEVLFVRTNAVNTKLKDQPDINAYIQARFK